jgi:hypothetical protein
MVLVEQKSVEAFKSRMVCCDAQKVTLRRTAARPPARSLKARLPVQMVRGQQRWTRTAGNRLANRVPARVLLWCDAVVHPPSNHTRDLISRRITMSRKHKQLVLALFDSEDAAEKAADALKR